MSREAYDALLTGLAQSVGLESLAADEEGFAMIQFDEKIGVSIQYLSDTQEILLSAGLGEMPQEKEAELALLRKMAEANLFWGGTQGATLGYDTPSRLVILAREIPLVLCSDYSEFEGFLTQFVDTAEAWMDEITPAVKS